VALICVVVGFASGCAANRQPIQLPYAMPAIGKATAASPARRPPPDDRRGVAMPASCTLAIKAIPHAPRSEVVGWLGDALKIKIHAPPVEGKANEALCEFLAETLGLSRRAVTVQRGDTSRLKLIRIDGLARDEVLRKLGV